MGQHTDGQAIEVVGSPLIQGVIELDGVDPVGRHYEVSQRIAAGAALVSGISVAVLWPRVGIVVLYSLTGVSILISMLLLAIETGRPSWVSRLPEQTWAQVLVLAVLVGIGAFVQWKLGLANAVVGGGGAGGSPKGPKPPSKKK